MKRYSLLFLALGLLFLLFLVRKLGAGELLACFRALGWKITLPILLFIPNELFRSLSWSRVLASFGAKVKFGTLCQVRLIGEAVSSMTPFNFAGGDPFKAWVISKSHVSKGIAVATIVIERSLQIMATFAVIVTGTAAGLILLPLTRDTRLILLGALLVLVFLVGLLVVQQRRGLMFRTLTRFLDFFGLKRFMAGLLEKLERQDHSIRTFYVRDHRLFLTCLAFHLVSRFFAVLEILLIGRLLGVPMTMGHALFFASIIPMTNMLMSFIPGSLGALEGVMGAVFHSMNWNPAVGVSLQLVRRVRQVFWTALGFILMRFSFPEAKGRQPASNPSPAL